MSVRSGRLRGLLSLVAASVLISAGVVATVASPAAASCPDQWCGPWGTIGAGVNVRNAPWVGATILARTTTAESVEVHCYYYGGTYGGSQFLINGTWHGIWDQIVDTNLGVAGFPPDVFAAPPSDTRTIAPSCGVSSPPVTPTGVTAVALGTGHIRVHWNDTNNGGAHYLVTNGNTSISANGATTYDWTGLAPGTYMCFAVAAQVISAQSSWSPYACTTTPTLAPPTGVTATTTSSYAVHVGWTDQSGGDATLRIYDGANTYTVPAGTSGVVLTGYRPNRSEERRGGE